MVENWLRSKTEQRLSVKQVEDLFSAYSRFGILASTANIIESVSEKNRLPIMHTLASHVSKEKSVLTYGILRSGMDLSEEKVVFVSSAIDLLWTFSLMYDDMFDHDQMRSGLPSAWVKFGSGETYQAAYEGLDRIKTMADQVFSSGSGNIIEKLVSEGLASLKQHREMKTETSVEELLINYRQRALFHTALPFVLSGIEKYRDNEAFSALENLNLAGQILNDLKDVSPKYVWLREGFSDIRSGVMTIPIAILLNRLSGYDRSISLSVFGKYMLTDENKRIVLQMLSDSDSMNLAINLSANLYEKSRSQFRNVLNSEFVYYAEGWINYKLEQLSELNG